MPGFDAHRAIPPLPFLHIRPRLMHGTLLILPASSVPADLKRFQFDYRGLPGGQRGEYALAHLGPTDFDTTSDLRRFCAGLHYADLTRMDDYQVLAWLRDQVKSGRLAALWIESEDAVPSANASPAKAAPAFSPSSSAGQKIIALFKAVPKFLPGAAKAQFEAFITPENLAIMAGFLALIAAAQAIPGADAVVDAALVAIAWASTGWSGVVAVASLIKAVLRATDARTENDIDAAAKIAAEALLVLGLTAFMGKLLLKARRAGTRPEPAPEPEPTPARGSTDDVMRRYARGGDGVTYPRRADQFQPDSVYDPDHPTPDQDMAIKQLKNQYDSNGKRAWNGDKIDQVLNSGSDFGTKSFTPGDNLYKIGNSNLDPATPSPYLLDQNSMNQLINKGYVSQDLQVTDAAGVKQQLALPCYNAAQSVFQGQVTEPATGVVSKVNSAHELFNLDDGAGGVTEGQILMKGGGSQVSLPPSSVTFGN